MRAWLFVSLLLVGGCLGLNRAEPAYPESFLLMADEIPDRGYLPDPPEGKTSNPYRMDPASTPLEGTPFEDLRPDAVWGELISFGTVEFSYENDNGSGASSRSWAVGIQAARYNDANKVLRLLDFVKQAPSLGMCLPELPDSLYLEYDHHVWVQVQGSVEHVSHVADALEKKTPKLERHVPCP